MSKLRVSLCRKNGSDRDLNELPGIAILRPFRSGIQVRSPEIIGSWVRRRRAKVDEKLVARSAVCAPKFDTARASLWRVCRFRHVAKDGLFLRRLVALTGRKNSEVLCCASLCMCCWAFSRFLRAMLRGVKEDSPLVSSEY